MFKPHRMSKITLFTHRADREKILAELHALGVLQPQEMSSELVSQLRKVNLDESDLKLSDHLLRISALANILRLLPRRTSLIQSLLGLETLEKRNIKPLSRQEVLVQSQQFLDSFEQVLLEIEKRHAQYLQKKEQLGVVELLIHKFTSLGIPLHLLRETDHVRFVCGTVASTHVSRITQLVEKETLGCAEVFAKSDKKESLLIVVHDKEYQLQLTLKKAGVTILSLPELPHETDLVTWVERQLYQLREEKRAIFHSLEKYKDIFFDALVIRENLEVMVQRDQLVHKMHDSEQLTVISGWMKTHDIAAVRRKLEQITKGAVAVTLEDPAKDEDVPVEQNNPFWLKPFEMLTALYSLPRYGSFDPTVIIGPIFLIYAAFMLTDAGYGLILALVGFVLYAAFSRYDLSLKHTSILLMGMGSLAVVFGILTGSYFGDFPKYVVDSFFGLPSDNLAVWKDPLKDPLYFLMLSIGIALIQLNIGLLIGSIENIINRDWKTFLGERGVFFLLQASVASFLFGAPFAGKVLLGVTIGLILLLKGPLGLLGMTGFMGDTISFSRLFALALSTSGIALAVNLLANLVLQVPYVGIILAVCIFLAGHLFGFAMNSIGAFVHALRLQFVEFFGKFYEGGGNKFAPYKEERIYTEVKR